MSKTQLGKLLCVAGLAAGLVMAAGGALAVRPAHAEAKPKAAKAAPKAAASAKPVEAPKPAAPVAADPVAETARRAEVVATFDGGTITVGELEDEIAHQSPYLRERYKASDALHALLDKSVRTELLALEAERRGYGKNDAVDYTVKQNAVQAMLKHDFDDKVSPESISAADVKAYYEAHISEFVRPALRRASLLLVATEPEAKALLEQAKTADMRAFRELVRTKTIDEDGKLRGGDLRYFDSTGKIAEETAPNIDVALAKAAFALKNVGDTSDPIKTDRGFAILKVTGQREAHEEKLADADEVIRSRLWRERRDSGIDALLTQLRAQLKPEVHPELVDAIKFDDTAPLPPPATLPPGFPRQKPGDNP